jgi:hypothetical protein
MTDRIRERLKNPALRLMREIAEAQLRRAGVKLSPDWSRHEPVEPQTEGQFTPELIRRLAGE